MGKIRIVTDSTGDLTLNELKQNQIELLPDIINFEHGSYRELEELSVAQFYQYLSEAQTLPTTAMPSPGDMQEKFKAILSQGDDIMAYFISREMSGTMHAAQIVAKSFEHDRITIVESGSVSLSLGFMVRMAAKAATQGRSRAEILSLTDYIKNNFKFYFVVDSLESLRKGGRIGKATAFLGTMLNIRPLLEIKDGMVCPVERIRGKSKAVDAMVSLVDQHIKEQASTNYKVILGYTGFYDDFASYKADILEKLQLTEAEVSIVAIGAAVGTHAGANAIALGFMPWPDEFAAMVN